MSIIVNWDDENRTIGRLEFHGRWTLDELSDAGQQVREMSHAVGYEIGLILDMRNGPMLPDRIIDHASQAADMRSDKLDGVIYFVVVGSDMLGKTLFKSFCKVCRPNKLMDKVAFVDSLEEARAILAQHIGART